MKVLKGEIIKNREVIKETQMPYKDTQGFFIALVNICEQLKVDIPVWTSIEDRKLQREGEVLISEGENTFFKVYTQDKK